MAFYTFRNLLGLRLRGLVGPLVFLLALSGCRVKPASLFSNNSSKPSNTPYCLNFKILQRGEAQDAYGCAQTKDLCEQVEKTANSIGRLADILAVGKCYSIKEKESDE